MQHQNANPLNAAGQPDWDRLADLIYCDTIKAPRVPYELLDVADRAMWLGRAKGRAVDLAEHARDMLLPAMGQGGPWEDRHILEHALLAVEILASHNMPAAVEAPRPVLIPLPGRLTQAQHRRIFAHLRQVDAIGAGDEVRAIVETIMSAENITPWWSDIRCATGALIGAAVGVASLIATFYGLPNNAGALLVIVAWPVGFTVVGALLGRLRAVLPKLDVGHGYSPTKPGPKNPPQER